MADTTPLSLAELDTLLNKFAGLQNGDDIPAELQVEGHGMQKLLIRLIATMRDLQRRAM